MTDPMERQVACATCGWKGPIGVTKLSKHPGGQVDCPKCESPEIHFAEQTTREVDMENPTTPGEQH